MTDPLTPAEAAAANAVDASYAAEANANADLVAGETALESLSPEEQARVLRVIELEKQLHDIKERKVAAGQGIPHAKPGVPTGTPEIIVQNASPGVVEAAVAPSAKLAQLQAAGAAPVKRRYAYQRNRK